MPLLYYRTCLVVFWSLPSLYNCSCSSPHCAACNYAAKNGRWSRVRHAAEICGSRDSSRDSCTHLLSVSLCQDDILLQLDCGVVHVLSFVLETNSSSYNDLRLNFRLNLRSHLRLADFELFPGLHFSAARHTHHVASSLRTSRRLL